MPFLLRDAPDFPGSRYAPELAKGALDMRFPPHLEAEYRQFYLTERRSHARSFNLIMLTVVALGAAGSLLVPAAHGTGLDWVCLSAIAFCFGVLVWTAYGPRYERHYLVTARYLSVLIATISAVEVAARIHAGAAELFGLLTVYSLGIYFLTGILYRAAVQANVAMVVAFTAMLLWLHEPAGRIVELTGMLAGTATIGGIAFRHQGIRFRRSFLERGLIGEISARDGLTGLKNRRAFDEHLKRIWHQALRDRRQLVVLMIDVDHFKKFNDRYGHQAGDEALQRIAQVVDGLARRPLDLAARYGGEELAMILFDMSREHAERLADGCRGAIQNLRIPHADASTGVITISIGVALVFPALDRSPDGAVQLADEALYAAKGDGRNTVRVFESEYKDLSTGRFRLK